MIKRNNRCGRSGYFDRCFACRLATKQQLYDELRKGHQDLEKNLA
jgi:hypothetical protein